MKNWLKKQKYKIAIVLCSILSIFTLFLGINKTYAYETDAFSYTTSLYTDSTYQTEVSLSTYNNIDNLYYAQNKRLYFNINNLSNNTYLSNYYFMINMYLWNSNYQLVSSGTNISITYMPNGYSINYQANERAMNDGYYTAIFKFNSANLIYSNNSIYLNFNIPFTADLYIKNIDIVSSTDIGLSQYYETYYGQIEDNYNTLLDNYNDLQEDYSTLENNYNTLESNYNDLQDNYDDLENDYNSLESSYESLAFEYNDLQSQFDTLENALSNLPNYNGMQSFIDSFNGATFELYGYAGISGKIENSPTYTLSNFNNSNFNLSRDTDTFYTWIQNNINTYGGFDLIIVLNVPYTTSLSCSFSNTNYNHTISIYSEVSGLAVATYDDYNNESVILINDTNNYSIVQIRLSLTQQDYDFILSSNIYGDQYMNGYNNGYNQSLIEWNSELNTARNTIESQRNTIRTLQQQLNTANQYDLNKLMWTIGSTPFESFKQIWNVNFFGVNISTMITGFITGIIVLWIIKKFFL